MTAPNPDPYVSLASREAAARAFRDDGIVRVWPALTEALAAACYTALRESEHRAIQHVDPEHGFQCWRFGFEPGTGCEHPLCELGRWLRGDAVAWVSEVAGLALAAEDEPMLFSDKAAKSAFRDVFDARERPNRIIGIYVQLSPAPWPPAWGGHLDIGARSLAPAWNAIDLVDLRAHSIHRLPMIDRHVPGFTIVGGYRAALPPS